MKNERVCVIDVEATGLNTREDRITEVGIIEMFDFEPTGRFFHSYIYSGREIPRIVIDITGITSQFLKDKLRFSDIADDMLNFIGLSKLVAHNSSYDEAMINRELKICRKPQIDPNRFIDTYKIAKEKYAGKKASQDAIMKRLGIDASMRDKHGAIVDAYLLSLMYKKMCFEDNELFIEPVKVEDALATHYSAPQRPHPLPKLMTYKEGVAHRLFVDEINKLSKKKSLWPI